MDTIPPEYLCFVKEASLCGVDGKSFEELRYDDYLVSFARTRAPPAPISNAPPWQNRKTVPLKTAEELPTCQVFTGLVITPDIYQSLVCEVQYHLWSPEELRYHAYLKGHKDAPANIAFEPFVISNVAATITPSGVPTALSTAPISGLVSNGVAPGETMVSISGQAEYARHSFEELRVAYLKFGRMMNSDELDKLNGATTPAPLLGPGLGVTTPIAPSASALFGSSTFGSTTPFTAPQHKLF